MTLRKRLSLLEQTQPPAGEPLPMINLTMTAAEAGGLYERLIRRPAKNARAAIVDLAKITPADAAAAYRKLIARENA